MSKELIMSEAQDLNEVQENEVNTSSENVVVDEVEKVEQVEVQDKAEQEVNEESKKGGELPRGVQKRIDKLTAKVYELSAQNQKLFDSLNSQPQKKIEEMTDVEYIDHQVQARLNKIKEQEELAKRNAEKFNKEVERYSEILPDFKQVIAEASSLELPQEAFNFIAESDLKSVLAYKIAKDEEIQDKIDELASNPNALKRYLTKLEIKLEDELESRKQKKSVPTSKPIGSVTKSEGISKPSVKNPEDMSIAEFREWKKLNGRK